MKNKISLLVGIVLIVVAIAVGIFYIILVAKKEPPEPKYVVVVAKFSDVFKYVVVRRHIGDHIIIEVNDKTFGHTHVGDSILHTGN